LSTPFLARLHEEPHDYFRFTRHGLRELLTKAGFSIARVHATGGLFAFLGHQPATVLCSLTWGVPVVRDVVLALVALAITAPCRALDWITQSSSRFPSGYVIVAECAS
jgi:hypothetical protein